MKPFGYYASARSDHSDADILDRITEEFGSQLQELTRDDKATVLICLIEAAINPRQIFIQDNFFSHENAEDLWRLARKLSPANQLALSVAIVEQLTYGEQN